MNQGFSKPKFAVTEEEKREESVLSTTALSTYKTNNSNWDSNWESDLLAIGNVILDDPYDARPQDNSRCLSSFGNFLTSSEECPKDTLKRRLSFSQAEQTTDLQGDTKSNQQ